MQVGPLHSLFGSPDLIYNIALRHRSSNLWHLDLILDAASSSKIELTHLDLTLDDDTAI